MVWLFLTLILLKFLVSRATFVGEPTKSFSPKPIRPLAFISPKFIS